jgi:hypothetical protein
MCTQLFYLYPFFLLVLCQNLAISGKTKDKNKDMELKIKEIFHSITGLFFTEITEFSKCRITILVNIMEKNLPLLYEVSVTNNAKLVGLSNKIYFSKTTVFYKVCRHQIICVSTLFIEIVGF